MSLCSCQLQSSVFVHLAKVRGSVLPVTSLLWWVQEELLVFSLFCLLFVLRMDWWSPRSLHAKPEGKGTTFHWHWAPCLCPHWIPWASQTLPRALPALPPLLQAACLPVFTWFWTLVSGPVVASPRLPHRVCSSFPAFLPFWLILAAPLESGHPRHTCPPCQGPEGLLLLVSGTLEDWLLLPVSLFCKVKESFSLPWDTWPWRLTCAFLVVAHSIMPGQAFCSCYFVFFSATL